MRFQISDFGEDFEISVKISKDFNQKHTRFQGVSSPLTATNRVAVCWLAHARPTMFYIPLVIIIIIIFDEKLTSVGLAHARPIML